MSEGAVMDWTDERSGELKSLYGRGLSFGEIASEMGVSRNAAIGKAHRMRLPAREVDVPAVKGSNGVKVRLHKIRTVKLMVVVTTGPPKPEEIAPARDYSCRIYRLKNKSCRYPLWQFNTPHEARMYCGHPTADFACGRPYCHRHTLLCGTERH